ncbi:MAG: heavy metal translocating P-type ATPase, partial [Sedimentibacter sp.]
MKKLIWRLIIGIAFFIAALISNTELIKIILFIMSYIFAGYNVVKRAVRNILRGDVFDENFLMSIASLGAFAIGEAPEGVAVMLFYQVGELFQSYAVGQSRKSIASLMDIRPDYANVKRGDELVKTDPDDVKIGDIIVVKPGEKVPLDGKVIDGSSMLDTSALTGESVPREISVGSDLLSGCININGVITAEVTKEFG